MPSKQQQSERSSNSSSPLPSRSTPRSLIVTKVSIDKDESWLFDDLNRNYSGVKRVSRNHDQDGNELSSIRIDFDSEDIVSKILDEDAIYIRNKPFYIRPYWPRICYRCQKEGHVSAECPERSLPEWRLEELMQERNSNFESLINGFENRWNTRLSQLKVLPTNRNVVELLPVVKDLSTVCQQLNQQNLQMQQQINTITNRIQNVQTKVNN